MSTMRRVVRVYLSTGLAWMSQLRVGQARGVEDERGGQVMTTLILALGLTFFPGHPKWNELDTSGMEWTVSVTPCHVAKDDVCLLPDEEVAAYNTRVDQQ
jgi:hypothetical protein